MRIEEERRSTFWEPLVNTYKGWALATQGQHDEGIRLMRDSLAAYRAAGSGITQVHMLGRLAEGLIGAGRRREAFEVLDEAEEIVEQMGEHYYEPELHRLRAEAQLAASAGSPSRKEELAEAESRVRTALDVARAQEARSLELRAAMTLCRVQSERGGIPDGRTVLEDVYSWFTEGFGTPDLLDAKALLETLSA